MTRASSTRTPADLGKGQTFDRWTVVHALPRMKGQRLKFRCRCACGTESDVSAKNLVSGKSGSCGCLQRERTSQVMRQRRPWARRDLRGLTIGDLTVIQTGPPLRWRGHPLGRTSWVCKCRCGRMVAIATSDLQKARTAARILSCGCRHLRPAVTPVQRPAAPPDRRTFDPDALDSLTARPPDQERCRWVDRSTAMSRRALDDDESACTSEFDPITFNQEN